MNAPSAPSDASTAWRAVRPVEVDDPAGGGVDRRQLLVGAEDPSLSGAHVSDCDHARGTGRRLAGRDRDGGEVVLGGDGVVTGEDVVHRTLEVGDDPSREHGHERDQCQTDHQCRGGRCGALGVADGVVARQFAHGARDPGGRPAEPHRQPRDDPRRQHRDADEDENGAEAHEDQHGAGAAGHEQAEQQGDEPQDGGGAAHHRAVLAPAAPRGSSRPRGPRRSARRGWRGSPGAGWPAP